MEIQDKQNLPRKSRVEKFAEETTLHGIRYVTNNRLHKARRFLWFVLLLVVAIWLVFGITSGVRKYFEYPVTTLVKFSYVKSIDFPAVTLCNYNQFRRSKLETYDPVYQKILLAIATGVNRDDIDWDYHDSLYEDDPGNLTKVAIEAGHQLEDMLLGCKWNTGEDCGRENFTKTITDFGVCYTFNADRDSERRLTVSQAGASQGLRLRLSAEQDDYYWGYYTAAGFKLFVHPQGEFPLVDQLGVSFSPGFETSISIRNVISRSLPSPYKSNCSDAKLQYSKNYSTEACWYECEARAITEYCECRFYKYPGHTRLCNPKDIVQCILPAIDNFSALDTPCDCPVSCMHETYEVKVSFALWPSDFETGEIATYFNKTTEFIRSNYLEVNVFFDILGYQEVIQRPSYDFLALQSDIGAYMGLLGGASIITIFEFIDCIVATMTRSRSGVDLQ